MTMVPSTDSVAVASAVMILAPATAGVVLLGVGRRLSRWAGSIATAGSLVTLAAAIWLLTGDLLPSYPTLRWVPTLDLSIALRAETVTVALATLISGIGALVLAYAGNYFGATDRGRVALATLSLFQAAMLGLVMADDLLLLFVFWELTGLCSFFLISTDAGKRADAYPAARRALLVTAAGALPMLLGFIYLTVIGGSSRLSVLADVELSTTTASIALALLLPGIITKSAQVPLHFWLPGAMAAPTPISAYLHSATMVKAGLILLLFLYPMLGGTVVWVDTLVPLGAITCIWGAYQALTQDDIKLLMAWSTVSQLGLITLTLGLGTDLAVRAAVLHLFAHAVFKAGLFLSVGAIDHATGTRALSALGGLGRRAPLLFVAVTILGGSMAGLPPFAGFLSKELILAKAMLANPIIHGIAITGIALGSAGTVAYTARFVLGTFLGRARSPATADVTAPGTAWMIGPCILAAVSLAAGVLAPWTDVVVLEPVTASLLGHPLEAPVLELWHGINAPLLWSLAIVLTGLALYRSRRLGERALLNRLPGDGAESHDRLLVDVQRIGSGLAHAVAGASPTLYLGAALVLGYLASASLLPVLAALRFDVGWATLAITAAQVALLVALMRATGRLNAIVILGLVGATVAMLYRQLNAPDLMLTQLLVEVLTTVFLVLALRLFRRHPNGRIAPVLTFSPGRALVAVGVGLGAASIAVALMTSSADTRLADYFRTAGPELAGGRNLVNVILVDFRGIDTMIETIVVVVAALGVSGLLRRSELGGDDATPAPAAPDPVDVGGDPLLRQVARLVLPLAGLFAGALLLKGHDEPGGGFVAGLVLAIGAILAKQAHGVARVETALPCRPETAALGGVVILFFCLLAPLAIGQSMLTHASGKLPFFGKWHGALLFDVGVTLAIAGAATTAASALWSQPWLRDERSR